MLDAGTILQVASDKVPGEAVAAGTVSAGTRLRLARQARGYSQQQLAGMAGVSRQALSAVESGHSDPSLRAALALATALGVTVEELFGPGDPAPTVGAVPAGPHGVAGARTVLAAVGDTFVAFPLAGDTVSRAGFLPAGGLIADPPTDGRVAVRPIGPPRATLLVAGCDPALPLLETPLSLLDPPVGFVWWPCGSAEALRLADRGLVHVAGVHSGDLTGAAPVAVDGPDATAVAARREPGAQTAGAVDVAARHREPILPRGDLLGFSSWREGFVLRGDLAGSVTGPDDIARQHLRIVNREPGAEARRLLDWRFRQAGLDPCGLPGYDTCARGHLQVASSVAAGLADVGVASEPAAFAYNLGFVPIVEERFDLLIPDPQRGCREVQGMLKVLTSPWLLAQLASLPGYRAGRCGERLP